MQSRTSYLLQSWLWALAPLYTLGFGTAAIMAWAAVGKHSWRQAATIPVYLAGVVMMLVFADGNGHPNELLFDAALAVCMFIGVVHSVAIRGWVYADPPARHESLRSTQAHALAAEREQHAVREQARELAAKDPAMARELGIGRPDLPGRDYPDGGLVDVNHVAESALVTSLGLPADLARRVAALRDRIGAFDSYADLLEELAVDGHTSDDDLAPFADRMVFLPRL